MKKILLFILSPFIGKKRYQKFFEILKNISFIGLNFRSNEFETDGELFFIKKVNEYFTRRDGKVVLFDVGANTGEYCKALHNVFGEKGVIYAFEPFSKVFGELEKLKPVISNLNLIKLGVGEKKESLEFFSSTVFNPVGGLYEKDFSRFGYTLDVKEVVDFISLDEFCQERGIEKINLLKIDVEGHDFFALKGASELLKTDKIDFIQFEYGSANYLSKTYLYDFFTLLSPNYFVYRLLKDGLSRIDEYNTDIEMHLLANYVAVNKNIDFDLK